MNRSLDEYLNPVNEPDSAQYLDTLPATQSLAEVGIGGVEGVKEEDLLAEEVAMEQKGEDPTAEEAAHSLSLRLPNNHLPKAAPLASYLKPLTLLLEKRPPFPTLHPHLPARFDACRSVPPLRLNAWC